MENLQVTSPQNLEVHQIANVNHICSFFQYNLRSLLLESGNRQIENYSQTNA